MNRLVFQKSFTVPGVRTCSHVFHATSDLVWICDHNNCILINNSGEEIDHLTEFGSDYGGHTVNDDGDLIYIDRKWNIKKRFKIKKVKSTIIKYKTAKWKPQCVYSSPSTGDLFVGMYASWGLGSVVRYNFKGEKIKTIEHNNSGQRLYRCPVYITENRNRDVIVSDVVHNAVVVTDRNGSYRFSYKGPSPVSGLRPAGICTDAQSQIMVCDCAKHNVQILNEHGTFLSLIQTSDHGIYNPRCLSYDAYTKTLWVGSGNKVNVFRAVYEDSQTDHEDSTEDLLQHMKTEETTVRHARGLVVGCAGAGKTTLLYSLMGKRLDEIKETKSTRGLQVYEHIFTVKEGSLIATENLQQRPLIRIPKSSLKKKNDKSKDADQRMIDVTDDLTKIEVTDDIPKDNTGATGVEEYINSFPSVSDGKPKEESAITIMSCFEDKESEPQGEGTIAGILSQEVIKKILDAQENEISVSMIDFAGQFAYYACHQIYMRSSAFYILVMDMTKSFEEVVVPGEEDQKESVFSTWKFKDYLEFWLNSIKSFGGPEAYVLVVATHSMGKDEDDIDDYFSSLWRSLPKEDKTWLSKHHNEETEFACELIEITEGERTQKLQSLKNALVEVVSNKLETKIPVRSSWALLEHLLRDSGKPIISYEEVQEMNRKVPEQYRLESEEEILEFLTFFHDHGILLYFKGEATSTHVILGLQWFSDAFSRLVADKRHVNTVCRRQHVEEWELFNQTGELNSRLVEALWKDEEESFEVYKTELMSYMERLRMLVSIGITGKGQSWYVPCMNKKPFKEEIIGKDFRCSSILCFRFTSFAIFVFYRLIAYCMGSLNWKVVPDNKDRCLFQTAAVFKFKNHMVLLGICDRDIQLQVVVNSVDIKTKVSCEVGNLIHKALEELTQTFQYDNLSFQRGYKCQKIFCKRNDTSFIPVKELCQLETEIPCPCCPINEPHQINIQETRRFWDQGMATDSSTPIASKSMQESDAFTDDEYHGNLTDNQKMTLRQRTEDDEIEEIEMECHQKMVLKECISDKKVIKTTVLRFESKDVQELKTCTKKFEKESSNPDTTKEHDTEVFDLPNDPTKKVPDDNKILPAPQSAETESNQLLQKDTTQEHGTEVSDLPGDQTKLDADDTMFLLAPQSAEKGSNPQLLQEEEHRTEVADLPIDPTKHVPDDTKFLAAQQSAETESDQQLFQEDRTKENKTEVSDLPIDPTKVVPDSTMFLPAPQSLEIESDPQLLQEDTIKEHGTEVSDLSIDQTKMVPGDTTILPAPHSFEIKSDLQLLQEDSTKEHGTEVSDLPFDQTKMVSDDTMFLAASRRAETESDPQLLQKDTTEEHGTEVADLPIDPTKNVPDDTKFLAAPQSAETESDPQLLQNTTKEHGTEVADLPIDPTKNVPDEDTTEEHETKVSDLSGDQTKMDPDETMFLPVPQSSETESVPQRMQEEYVQDKHKNEVLKEFLRWFRERYPLMKIVHLYMGKQMIHHGLKDTFVLVIDEVNIIDEREFEYFGARFAINCKLWKTTSTECMSVSKFEHGHQHKINSADLSKIEQCLRKNSPSLFEKHSNLEVISASSFKSKENGESIYFEPCIVLYCSCKGVVPYKEKEFPKEIDGIQTDVREGFFYLFPNDRYFKRASDVLNPLMMGASIGKNDENKEGTLGGFVTSGTGEIGFITCGHVFYDFSPGISPQTIPFDVVQPSYGYRNTNEICGEHVKSIFQVDQEGTVDASFVKLKDRVPQRGLFSELMVNDLLEAGFSLENIPEYSTGATRNYSKTRLVRTRILRMYGYSEVILDPQLY